MTHSHRLRETAYGPGGEPGPCTYAADVFTLEIEQFALAERGIASVVEVLDGAAYVPVDPWPVVTVEEAIAAGLATRGRDGRGEVVTLGPGAQDFLNPRLRAR